MGDALAEQIRALAISEGFILCGVAPAIQSAGHSDLVRWIDSGYAGQMQYFADRIDAYQHPSSVLAGAKSIVALAYPYTSSPIENVLPGQGKIARYARCGVDYHDVIHPKLKRLCRLVQTAFPDSGVRGVVDTAPLMEREISELAGLGWRGKNTLLLNRNLGSYFFLACVLTDVELPSSVPHESAHCGKCTACLDACPTDAFVEAGVLDATRCISYLTIEHRGPIDVALRADIGDWVFGCDVCQEVCPWNRKPVRRETIHSQSLESLSLADLFSLSDDDFRRQFRKTPLWRTKRRGILRNAAIVLGNQRQPSSIVPLTIGLADEESIVRGASAWALGCLANDDAFARLRERLPIETDPDVRQEIRDALA